MVAAKTNLALIGLAAAIASTAPVDQAPGRTIADDSREASFSSPLAGDHGPVKADGMILVADDRSGVDSGRDGTDAKAAAAQPLDLPPETTKLVGNGRFLTIASYDLSSSNAAAFDGPWIDAVAARIVANLKSPDVIALQGLEHEGGGTDENAVAGAADLWSLSNAILLAGGPSYEALPGRSSGDGTGLAFLYDPDRVELDRVDSLGADRLAALGAGEPDAFEETAAPQVGVFRFNGHEITVVNNRLASPSVQNPDAAELRALNDLADQTLEADPQADIVVLGNLSTDDAMAIPPGEAPVLTRLAPAGDRHRDPVDGRSEVSASMFVSDGLMRNARLDIVHVHVEGAESDHQPLVARLKPGGDGVYPTDRSSSDDREPAAGTSELAAVPAPRRDPFAGAERLDDDFVPAAYDRLVFADEFEGDELDRSKWCTRLPFGGGPALQIPDRDCTKFIGQGTGDYANEYENQRFRDINSRGVDLHVVSDGTIKLFATNSSSREFQPFEAAALRSKFVFKPTAETSYYITSRVVLPDILGTWPAFYLNPSLEPDGEVQWPPEIDIFEAPVADTAAESPSTVWQHAQVQGEQTASGSPEWTFADTGFNTDWGYWDAGETLRERWIEIGAEWTAGRVCYFVDGFRTACERYRWVTNDGVPANPATVVMFLAIGGPWAGRNGIDLTAFPAALEADYIRVYSD